MLYEKTAGAIVFKKENEGIKFLLLEADSISTKNPHKFWGFPKGNVERGESDLQTAVRELKEETGITGVFPLPNFKTFERYMYRRDGDLVSKTATFFLIEVPLDTLVTLSVEHTNFGWFSLEEAMATIKIKSIKKILEEANSFLTSGNVQQVLM